MKNKGVFYYFLALVHEKRFPKEDSGKFVNKSITWLMMEAENGEVASQVILALLYLADEKEWGLEYSEKDAVKWFLEAAKQNNSIAQFYIGSMYSQGFGGLPKSEVEAIKWFQKAADQGFDKASEALKELTRK